MRNSIKRGLITAESGDAITLLDEVEVIFAGMQADARLQRKKSLTDFFEGLRQQQRPRGNSMSSIETHTKRG